MNENLTAENNNSIATSLRELAEAVRANEVGNVDETMVPIAIKFADVLDDAANRLVRKSHEPKALPDAVCLSCGEKINWVDQPCMRASREMCGYCHGNDRDAPCAYPSEGKPGCLRDARLSRETKDCPHCDGFLLDGIVLHAPRCPSLNTEARCMCGHSKESHSPHTGCCMPDEGCHCDEYQPKSEKE